MTIFVVSRRNATKVGDIFDSYFSVVHMCIIILFEVCIMNQNECYVQCRFKLCDFHHIVSPQHIPVDERRLDK